MKKAFFNDERAKLHHGDSAELLAKMDENSADSGVMDPPSGTGFMTLMWDDDKGGRDKWINWLSGILSNCIRVLKPGAHVFVWALPRTSHWTGLALEEAGFDIRDTFHHNFSTGFPKNTRMTRFLGEEWQGFGSAVKPAHEIWWMARAPIDKGGIAPNAEKWGTGALNIDACRVLGKNGESNGRWPPNQLFSHGMACTNTECHPSCPVNQLDQQSGHSRSGKLIEPDGRVQEHSTSFGQGLGQSTMENRHSDEGGASRFYPCFRPDDEDFFPFLYQAKPKPKEKCAGLEEEPLKASQKWNKGGIKAKRQAKAEKEIENCQGLDARGRTLVREDGSKTLVDRWIPGYSANNHPTVKSVKLMRWLCRLITPPGGKVLDPFAGSGSTGVAAIAEGFTFEGIERSEDYCTISKGRLIHALRNHPVTERKSLVRKPSFQQTLF